MTEAGGTEAGTTRSVERRLEDATSRFGTLIANLQAAVLVEDQDRRIVLTNRAFTSMFGIPAPPEALLGADCSSAAEESKHLFVDPEGFVASVERALAGRVAVTGEELAMLDGRFLERDYVPVYRDAEYLGHMWLYRDVTTRKENEQRLADQNRVLGDLAQMNARYRLIAENSSDVVMVIGLDGVIQWVSPSCRQALGAEPEELVGHTAVELLHPDDVSSFLPRVRAAQAAGLDAVNILRQRMGDGTYRWFEGVGRNLPAADGQPEMRVVRLRDVDAQHRAQLALAASEKALRVADENKDAFISALSHELRNPLAAVQSALWILEQEPAGTGQAGHALDIAQRQAAHLARLVDDLLDVTRLAQNRVTLRLGAVDLPGLLRQVTSDADVMFASKGIRLALHLPPDGLVVTADPARITQAVDNLLHNAAKFSNAGDSVTVSLDCDPPRTHAIITVSDTGHGIDPVDLPHLFEPFVQAEQSLDRSQGGLGLGLAIVRQIVTLHGGTVVARSRGVGLGSQFTMTLPVGSLMTAEPVVSPPVRSTKTPRLRVLLIEDDDDLRDVTAHILKSLGHDTVTAGTGLGGIEAAHRDRPDAILCDVGLPGMNGYEFARTIRSEPDLRTIPLVALTGYAQPQDLSAAYEAGFDVHLAKPIDRATLRDTLARLCTDCAGI